MAARHNGPKKRMPADAIKMGTPAENQVTFAGGTYGSFQPPTEPRSGRRSPDTIMVTMMTINGRPSRIPYSGHQLKSICILVNVLCTIPMATPVNTVGQKLRNLPMSAAPKAGIKKPNVKIEPLSCTSGEAKIATTAPTTDEITQPEAARKSGE